MLTLLLESSPAVNKSCWFTIFTLLTLSCLQQVHAEENAKPSSQQKATNASSKAFDFAQLDVRARELSQKPYKRDDGDLPDVFAQLSPEQYRNIHYREDRLVWHEEGLPFQLALNHRGYIYKDRVFVNTVEKGQVNRIAYAPELFDFGQLSVMGAMSTDPGFSGLSVRYPLKRDQHFDEITLFLGASYFKAMGLGQVQGLSARALAIDTGMNKAEEFPVFREFWVERPDSEATELVIYALLDSVSLTGAYRFVIQPGIDLHIDVQSKLYLRQAVDRLGIAPLTSMFLHGENTESFKDDYRPEVHDSDGLLMARHNGEMIWRPLNNPRQLRISVFKDTSPRGLGLLTRDRNFDHYQDPEAHYQTRPSAWVEPLGEWGPGSVYLLEIPSDAEKYDNIASFWVPDHGTARGKSLTYNYRLHFQSSEPLSGHNGRVMATRISHVAVEGDAHARRVQVDFTGDRLSLLSPEARIEADVGASSGTVQDTEIRKIAENGYWRLSFTLIPEKDKDPVELRAALRNGKDVLTETWLYQWNQK